MTSTLLEAPPAAPSKMTEEPPPEMSVSLEDRIPPHLQLSRRFAGTLFGFGLIYAWFTLKPLWHSDLWGHLTYGRWLATTGTLPSTEPLMPLARGVPFVDTAWLSQLLGYWTYQALGLAGLQALMGLVITAAAFLLFHRLQERTRSLTFAWIGVGLFLWLDAANLVIARPQLAGLLCAAVVLHRLTSREPRTGDFVLFPVLFALWANLHGSFVMGLALIGVFLVGRGIDLLRRTGTLSAVWHDQQVRRFAVWLQLAVIGTLANPYGLGLYAEVLTVAKNPNLQALTEWQPLQVRQMHGTIFLGSALLLACLYRWTPRRVAAWEPLLLCGLGLGTLWSARFGVWWGLFAGYLIVLHLHAALRKWVPWQPALSESPKNGKWSVVTLGLAWIFFAYSPLGMRLLHHKDPVLEKTVSSQTPVGLVNWLNEHPPQGLVFNPYEWGDYLQWAGPSDLQVFLNSHAHLVPRDVWLHYLQVVEQSSDWSQVFDRYGVNTVILDSEYRSSLIRRLKEHAAWKLSYEDTRGAVFVRRTPI